MLQYTHIHLCILDVWCIRYHSKRGTPERYMQKQQWFFRFPCFNCDLFVASGFFPSYSAGVLYFFFFAKKSHKWIDAVKSWIVFCFIFAPFSNYILLFFSWVFFLFQVLFSLIWFSRVCLNHSLLTYKVCLNKHVLFVCFGLVCMCGCTCLSLHFNRVYIVFLRLNW